MAATAPNAMLKIVGPDRVGVVRVVVAMAVVVRVGVARVVEVGAGDGGGGEGGGGRRRGWWWGTGGGGGGSGHSLAEMEAARWWAHGGGVLAPRRTISYGGVNRRPPRGWPTRWWRSGPCCSRSGGAVERALRPVESDGGEEESVCERGEARSRSERKGREKEAAVMRWR